ncbi:MAG: hypothetical protein VKN60_02020 [Cyanobacteriota bacterium]|nr:hypothetical protein [Cyanobacteriota bacterium]
MEITVRERLESLKAGALAALVLGLTAGLSLTLQSVFRFPAEAPTLWSAAGFLLSGFLFGVTYRYIVRGDDNPHLRDGAVLAFALVRSAGYLQALTDPLQSGPSLAWICLESVLSFGAARSLLDLALNRRWVRGFGCD